MSAGHVPSPNLTYISASSCEALTDRRMGFDSVGGSFLAQERHLGGAALHWDHFSSLAALAVDRLSNLTNNGQLVSSRSHGGPSRRWYGQSCTTLFATPLEQTFWFALASRSRLMHHLGSHLPSAFSVLCAGAILFVTNLMLLGSRSLG